MKKVEKKERFATIRISPSILEMTIKTIEELERTANANILPTLSKHDKKHLKAKFINRKLTYSLRKLTRKMFAEAAINYFIKHKIDPRFYEDSEELEKQVLRLRNQIFSFLQVQEQRYLIPMSKDFEDKYLKPIQAESQQTGDNIKMSLAALEAMTNIIFATSGLTNEELKPVSELALKAYKNKLEQLENPLKN